MTPESIALGDIKSGETRQQRFIVKGKKPFSIEWITCEDPRFEFQPPSGEKTVHVVPFRFRGGLKEEQAPGQIQGAEKIQGAEQVQQKVVILTSLGQEVETSVSARVLR